MRTSPPHPIFIACFVLSLMGAFAAGGSAIKASNCNSATAYRPHDPCDASHQVLADSAIAFGLCSLVLVIGGVGFQIGRSNRPAPPPPMPHAAAAGPPHPGNAPAPNQAPPWQGHS